MSRIRIGELLVQQGQIDALQLESALAHQRRWGGRLGRSIVSLGFLPEPAVLGAVSEQLGVPYVEIGEHRVPPEVLGLVPEKLVRSRRALPLSRSGAGRRAPVVVALADPGDLHVLDELAFATGLPVEPVLASERDLDHAIARLLDGRARPADAGFAARTDAIDVPPDTSPLTLLSRATRGRPGPDDALN
jgi:hypothetical protein